MIKREGRHGVIYSIICMCTCGWSPSYMRRSDAEKDWIEEFCHQILKNPECHMKDIREIQLRCAVWENRFGPCHQSAFTGALMASKTFLRLLQPSYLWCGKLFFSFGFGEQDFGLFFKHQWIERIFTCKKQVVFNQPFFIFLFFRDGQTNKNNTLLISLAYIKVTEVKGLFFGSPHLCWLPFSNQK